MTDEHYRTTLSMIDDIHQLFGELLRVLLGTNAPLQRVEKLQNDLRLADQRVHDAIVLEYQAK